MAKRTKKTDEEKREAAALKEAARAERQKKRAKNIEKYRRRQSSTSIYFLLWAAFSVLSLVIVLLFGFTQGFLVRQTYKDAAVRELSVKGREIESAVMSGPPDVFGGNQSAYLRYLSMQYDVEVFILDGNGRVLFPQEPHFEGGNGNSQTIDFSEEVEKLKERLLEEETGRALYENGEEYVYGSNIRLYGNEDTYLYVSKSLGLMVAVNREMGVRIALVAVFVFVLSFAVSSAVSGWLTKPITEMTKKARLLASGDFNVNFHGADYGAEMVELAETLNFARDELSKTDKMQKELIANVSHDFKTPLTMIKAYASMIMEISGEIPEKRNKHAQVIVDEADRLASLVADVLDLSKLRSGIDLPELTAVDMSAYVHEILGRFEYLKETKGYKIETEIEEGLYARVDELKIGQALYNLIGNAVNYTGEDKTVFVRLKRLDGAEGDSVALGAFRFSVTDTGAGIKQEEIATIWERYYRSAEAHKRPVKGTGLGLSIVKAVLERHRLHFGVESEVGKGSTFFVDFPIADEGV